jgi:hypothetical protein
VTYVLEGHTPVPEHDVLVWGSRFEATDRAVAYTEVRPGLEVSTVFLGIDFNPFGPVPHLFETMLLRDGQPGGGAWRYSTWEEAEAGHARIVAFERVG